jgi:L-alanine-DL-glutamate epimerase-like enolase superfamily enzyme
VKITGVEIHDFAREVKDMGRSAVDARYQPGTSYKHQSFAMRILTDEGISGEWVTTYIAEAALLKPIAEYLIGKNPLDREMIYYRLRRFLQQNAWIGVASVDICLWDIAGKYFGVPIYELLGVYRRRIPAYLSSARGDTYAGGLDSKEAFAEFAEEGYALGYRAFKIHPWMFGDASMEKQVELIRYMGERVGPKMRLMLDPACEFDTFGDALEIGRACDDAKFFWWEDPFKDGGVANMAHQRLRELVRTPLLQGEHARGLEQRMNLLTAGATNFVRGDVLQEGITSSIKLLHAAEALGIDVEFHCGEAETMQVLAAARNSNYFENGTLHPNRSKGPSQLFLPEPGCYAGKSIDMVKPDGFVEAPTAPGLGVAYNWEYIETRETGVARYSE